MKPRDLVSLDEMMGRLDRTLAGSTADSTEIVWIEARRRVVRHDTGGAAHPAAPTPEAAAAPIERTLAIRVRQSGRTGFHRLGGPCDASEMENAVRDAMAQARLAPPSPLEPLAGSGERRTEQPAAELYHDPGIAELDADRVHGLLRRLAPGGETQQADAGDSLSLEWLEGCVAVANSAGLRRAVRVTAANFTASCGRGAGAGSVAAAARHLAGLSPAGLLAEARTRQASGATRNDGPPPPLTAAAEISVVLAEQATALLIDLLNRQALTAAAQRGGAASPHEPLGETLFARCIDLRDDATDPRTLPFPFDLAGWAKRPVDLVTAGRFVTSAVDGPLGRELERAPTPHSMAADETIAANLLLVPGSPRDAAPIVEGPEPATPPRDLPPGTAAKAGAADSGLEALLAGADGGIWIGALQRIECFDRHRLRFRALARGVRRIAGGKLGTALPDLLWEGSLLEVLAHAVGTGDRTRAIVTGDMLFGATAAPLLALRGSCSTASGGHFAAGDGVEGVETRDVAGIGSLRVATEQPTRSTPTATGGTAGSVGMAGTMATNPRSPSDGSFTRDAGGFPLRRGPSGRRGGGK